MLELALALALELGLVAAPESDLRPVLDFAELVLVGFAMVVELAVGTSAAVVLAIVE